MQEISPHVYIETAYAGVTLGAISWTHGLILIDAPFRAEDARSWRSALLNLGGGVDRLLINLDAHFDRTLGARAMDCTILGHEKLVQVFRARPVTFKSQSSETGAEWELYNGLGSIRWSPPEITFSHALSIHWDSRPLALDYHPGPASGAIWATLPEQKILFVGDAVIAGQPPFLANADLPAWLETLDVLLQPQYQDYILIGGRNGLITHQDVLQQRTVLEKIHTHMETLAAQQAQPEDALALLKPLLSEYPAPQPREAQFEQRLRWGLVQYFIRRYRSTGTELEE